MKRPLLWLLLLGLCSTAAAQFPFSRSYSFGSPAHINGSALTPDGGLVLCGWSSDGADSMAMGHGFLMRTDAAGNLLWVREHDGGLCIQEIGTEEFPDISYRDIHLNADSTYLLVGRTFQSWGENAEFLAMGIDALGDTLWTTLPLGAPPADTYVAIAPAAGGYAFVSAFSSTGINEYLAVDKMDVSSGARSTALQMLLFNLGAPTSLRATQGGGCVLTGYTEDAGMDVWVRALDAGLNTAWETTFGLPLPSGPPRGIICDQAPDASFWGAVQPPTSATTGPMALVHFQQNGTISSCGTYALPGTPIPSDLRIGPNGKMLICGTAYLGTAVDSSYAFLLQADPNGTVDWAWRYDGEPGDSLRVVAMEVVPATGDVYLIGSAGTGRPLIIRTDSAGITGGCAQTALVPTVGAATWNTGALLNTDTTWVPDPFTERFAPIDSVVYGIAHEQCGSNGQLYRAEGAVYYDSDANGAMDPGEVGLPWYPVSIAPGSAIGFTGATGEYAYVSDVAGTYAISPALPQQWWGLTSDSATYNPTFSTVDTLFTDLDFGYDPILDTTILVGTALTGASCAFPFWNYLRVRNLGTTTPQGIITYTYDAPMQLLNTEPPHDSIVGQTIYWHFDSLWFGELVEVDVRFELIPLTWNIGDTLTTEFTVLVDDGLGNLSLAEQQVHDRVITCAYDPNNKEVIEPGSIPHDQAWLTYTINFQNTGTDTAYTVRIEDQLSAHLQWNTLQYLGSSHDLTGMSIGALGKAQFTFANILLPDSNVNEPESHGFVTYRIAPRSGLTHLIPIGNNAGIFFDLNAPVITNTVVNRVINCGAATPWPIWVVNFGNDLYAGTSTSDTLSYAYQWYLNGLPVAGAAGSFSGGGQAWWPASASGDYTIELVDQFGCTSTSAPFPHVFLAVGGQGAASFAVVPNPFHEHTRLISNLPIRGTIELLDLHGRVVRILQGNGTREVLIERGDLASGVYTVRVKGDDAICATTRLVVH